MKKVLGLMAIIAFVISFSSCQKEIECECTTTVDGVEAGTSSVTVKDKNPDCGDYEVSSTSYGTTTKTTCKEK